MTWHHCPLRRPSSPRCPNKQPDTNTIIGSDKIDFKDISLLYKSYIGIITTCCGKDLNLDHKNPSHFLCFFSVLVFYLGFTNISGFIININYEK